MPSIPRSCHNRGMMQSLLPTLLSSILAGFLATHLINRLLLRWDQDLSLLGAFGRCARCGGNLPWQAILPGLELVGYRVLPTCGHAMPLWRGAMLVVVTGASVGLALLYQGAPWLELSQTLLLFYLLLPLTVIDLRSLEVESRIVVAGIVLRFCSLALLAPQQLAPMVGGALMGAGLFALVGFFYQTLRGRSGLGEGDVAVMGLLGAFVGWHGILPVAGLAALCGLLIGTPIMLALRRPLSSPIPFVPFLALSGLAIRLSQTLWLNELWRWMASLNLGPPG